jgi:hypothetical protein
MKLTVMLADAANADQNGKVSALGLGWVVIPTPTPPMALVVFVDLEPAETLPIEQVTLDCELVDEQGEHVELERRQGPVAFNAVLTFTSKSNLDLPVMRSAFAVGIAPGLPLPPGRYQWKVAVKESGVEDSAAFAVRSAEELAAAGREV